MLKNNIKEKLLATFNLSKNANININRPEIIHGSDSESEESDAVDNSDSELDVDLDREESVLDSEESVLDSEESVLDREENIIHTKYTHYADALNKEIPSKAYKNVCICMYKINTQELLPFIMFLLFKNDDNTLNFYNIDDYKGKDIALDKFKMLFAEENVTIDYKGFIVDDNKLILILNYNDVHREKTSIKHVTYDTKRWWVLTSEIINYKNILTFKINNFVTQFLIENSKLIFLYDSKGIVYETPEIGYYGNYYKKIAAVASLGLSRQSPYSSFGPFYYFSDYTHAMRNAFWTIGFKPKKVSASETGTGTGTSASERETGTGTSTSESERETGTGTSTSTSASERETGTGTSTSASETYITVDDKGRYEKGGIVKFALFTGRTKMLMGVKSDVKDDSSISIELAEKNEFVKAMLKLRDSSAKWTKEYNSIRIGSHNIKLPGKPDIHTNPMIALKEYDQQVPLEYYFVDTSQDVTEANINTAVIS